MEPKPFLLDTSAIFTLLELLRDIRVSEQELAAGQGVPHGRARIEMRRRLGH